VSPTSAPTQTPTAHPTYPSEDIVDVEATLSGHQFFHLLSPTFIFYMVNIIHDLITGMQASTFTADLQLAYRESLADTLYSNGFQVYTFNVFIDHFYDVGGPRRISFLQVVTSVTLPASESNGAQQVLESNAGQTEIVNALVSKATSQGYAQASMISISSVSATANASPSTAPPSSDSSMVLIIVISVVVVVILVLVAVGTFCYLRSSPVEEVEFGNFDESDAFTERSQGQMDFADFEIHDDKVPGFEKDDAVGVSQVEFDVLGDNALPVCPGDNLEQSL